MVCTPSNSALDNLIEYSIKKMAVYDYINNKKSKGIKILRVGKSNESCSAHISKYSLETVMRMIY